MKSKFFVLKNYTFLRYFSLILFCSVAVTNASAQLVPIQPARDSSMSNYSYYTRAEILSMTNHDATDLLATGTVQITDLLNATFDDYLNSGPDEHFLSQGEFYALPAGKELLVIQNPDKYKVYKPWPTH